MYWKHHLAWSYFILDCQHFSPELREDKKTNRNETRHSDVLHSGFLHAKNTYIAPYSSSGASRIIIRAYISKIADSTISAGVSKNSYSKAKCVCNASIIFMESPSNIGSYNWEYKGFKSKQTD